MEKVIYLHGFASSPKSKKATLFRERFREQGVDLVVPDLSGGEFVRQTLTRQMGLVMQEAGRDPVSLIGSSLGGYLAALCGFLPRLRRLVLMAPAFGFARRYAASLGEEKMLAWQEDGYMEVFHYGSNTPEPLSWSLMEDARFQPAEPDVIQPMLIFHGVKDDVVPVEASRHYAKGRPNVELVEYESGHELMDVVDDMWLRTWRFLNQPDGQ